MISDANLLELVTLIYEAAEDSSRWTVFLERFAAAIGSEGTALWIENSCCSEPQITAAVRLDPVYLREYEEHFAATNVWLPLCNRRFRPGEVRYSQAVTSDSELQRTEWYNDYLRRQNLFYSAGLVVAPGEPSSAYMTTVRSQAKGEFTEQEGQVFLALRPHLKRAMQFHQHQAVYRASTEVLDYFPTGVILFGTDGRVLLLSRQAQLILDQRDGLCLSRQELTTERRDETNALRRLIQEATQTGAGRGIGSGGTLAISRLSHRRSFSLLVCPLRPSTLVLGSGQPVAVVFVSDPEQQPETNPDRLARLFGLTPAEAKVAAVLLQGKGLDEAAGELQISYRTVRAHLRRIFQKTGTCRQGELVRLLITSPAALRR